MRAGITSDYVAHDLCIGLIPRLRELSHDVVDCGPAISKHADYVKWRVQLAREVATACFDVRIATCGSSIGISIIVDKIEGVRATCVSKAYSAAMSRHHNSANVLRFGSRVAGPGVVLAIRGAFLGASFRGGRHAGWVAQLRQLDTGDVSPLGEGC